MRLTRLGAALVVASLLPFAASCGGDARGVTAPDAPRMTAAGDRTTGVTLTLMSGGGQTGAAGYALPDPIVVRVLDHAGVPVAGANVNFIAPTGSTATPSQAKTDDAGLARSVWTLGTDPNETLRVSGEGGTLTVAALAIPVRKGMVAVVIASGNNQRGPAGTPLPQRAVARVVRDDGRPAPGVAVEWVPGSGGSASASMARTDSAGLVGVTWTLGPKAGAQTLAAVVAGVSSVTFHATATAPPFPVASVRLAPDSLVLDAGSSGSFTAVALEAGGKALPVPGFAWTSSSPAVARVDSAGGVTAVAAGSAKITASVYGISASATVRVRVAPPKVARVTVSPDSLLLATGATGSFTATAYDAAGHVLTGRAVAWTSSAPAVATVSASGTITGVAEGTARVTATVEGASAYASVRVKAPQPRDALVTRIVMRVAGYGGIVDVSRSGQTLNFEIDLARPATSAHSVTLRVRSPSGTIVPCMNADATDEFYRRYICAVSLDAGAQPGVWAVDRVTVDGAVYTAADLAAIGTAGREFDVFGTGADTSPPEVRTVVPMSLSGSKYYVQWGLVDHISGVASSTLHLRDPQGRAVSCNGTSLYGANARNGDWICGVPVTPGSGTWHVESITATDTVGNTATYTVAEIDRIRGVRELTFLTYDFTP